MRIFILLVVMVALTGHANQSASEASKSQPATIESIGLQKQFSTYRDALQSTNLLYSLNCRLLSLHAPAVVELSGKIWLQTASLHIDWPEIGDWEKGRPLKLVYGKQCGMLLVDPESGKFNPVFEIKRIANETEISIKLEPEPHPIERIMKMKYEADLCMAEANSVLGEEVSLWATEVDRIYDQLMLVGDPVEIEKARKAWDEHMEASFPVILLAASHGGSGWHQNCVFKGHMITALRNHALELNSMLGERVGILSNQ